MRHARAVMHVGIAYPRRRGKRPGIPGACAPAILRIWQEAHHIPQSLGMGHVLYTSDVFFGFQASFFAISSSSSDIAMRRPTHQSQVNRLPTSRPFSHLICLTTVIWYVCCVTWSVWHVRRCQIGMVVPVGPVPSSRPCKQCFGLMQKHLCVRVYVRLSQNYATINV